MLSRSGPGILLQLLVVAGTATAALAIRPRAGRAIIPVPALSYVAAALLSGIVFDRSVTSSRTVLALDAAQWIANGFFAMALATVLAAGIAASRWYLWRRGRPGPRDQEWPPPMPPPAGPARGDRRPTEVRNDPGPRGTGPRPGSVPPAPARPPTRRTEGSSRRADSGPYNFSSGA